ncbi:TonB-dependent receptor [Vulgatibacter incomptus]|uniref:TonB-dependent receptor n=1 Tax=Vulgatibacter incomptus TaxID=1391653 RepID=UPI001470520D|nr:TonB-dependent receptor [Vulgatibacter incomptus]
MSTSLIAFPLVAHARDDGAAVADSAPEATSSVETTSGSEPTLISAADSAQAPAGTADDAPASARGAAAPGIELDEIEVRGERPARARSMPSPDEGSTSFGTVIEAGDFAGQRLETAELLLQAPGTRVRRTPAGATLMLRGTSADQTLVFLDGIRLNTSVGGGVDLRTLPQGLIDRITVLRGNEGARYGAGALGGVALISTAAPEGGDAKGSFSLSGGSFGTYGLDASVTGGSAKLQGIAALSLQQSAGDFPAPFNPTPSNPNAELQREIVSNNDSKSAGLLLKGSARVGATRLHALTQGSVGERGIPGTLYWRDTQRRGERRLLAALRAEPAERGDHAVFGGLELRHDEIAVWGGDIRGVTAQPSTDEPGTPWQRENALDATVGAETAPLSWTLIRVEARAGGEWLDSPYRDAVSRERLAASVADELYLGRVVTIAPSVRYDRIGAFDGLSPKLGVSLRPLRFLELRGNAGRTFRAPSIGELYLEQGPLKANPGLRPEHGYTVDGGAVVRTSRLLVQVSAFYSRVTDLISYEVVSNGISKPFNFLEAEVTGGEAEAAGTPLPWLTLSASYSLARTRNLRDDPRFFGKELPFRPSQRLQGRAAAGPDGYEAFVEGSWQSAQFVNRSNAGELPSQLSFRAGGGARLWHGSYDGWLSGQIENAFDTELVDQLGFPQPGRAFFLTLRVVPFGAAGST